MIERVRSRTPSPAARARLVRASLAVALAMLVGCAHTRTLDSKIRALEGTLHEARERGAYVCAPRELALAQANFEFAGDELSQGNVPRAEQHYVIAQTNAQAALDLASRERCVDHPAAPGDADGDGYPDPSDSCPNEPEDFDGVADQDGCPEEEDSDGDGITDTRDLCPTEVEDVDGRWDEDGCPDLDEDADGILDADDRCPLEGEDRDGFEDTDGCPERDNDADSVVDLEDQCPNEAGPPAAQGCPRVYENVEVTATHVVIRQTIQFEHDKAVIRPPSFPILETVAQVLRDFPAVKVEVQGHTDDRGNDAYNLRLSDARASSVRDFLIAKGIDPARLTSRGYGETRPIDSNRTSRGRAANRRVEFVRTESGAAPSAPPP